MALISPDMLVISGDDMGVYLETLGGGSPLTTILPPEMTVPVISNDDGPHTGGLLPLISV